jgi:cysteine desulfurase
MSQSARPIQRRIYMDANATTPLLPNVFDAMRPFLLENFGNASSIHQQGQRARAAVDKARDAVARLLNVRAAEICFTSGGTESDNLALFGVLNSGDHLITSQIEHHAVLHAAEALAKKGVEVTFLPCDASGLIAPAALQAALRPNTRLVSIMFANNETGVIQPISELAQITRQHSAALFHTDAVQGAGKLPLDLSPTGPLANIDLLALSGHKMYAPQGTGVLFVRHGIKLAPLFHGGTHERQRRAGTENVAGIVALGKAAELASAWLAPTIPGAPSQTASSFEVGSTTPASLDSETGTGAETPHALTHLRDLLEQTLLAQIPASGVNGAGVPRTANTTNLYFDHIEAESLVITLDLNGLSVSGGSACQSGAAEPSHVLTAMGLAPERARSSIRISLSRMTSAQDVDDAIRILVASVAQLRSISRSWKAAEAATRSAEPAITAVAGAPA